MPIVRKQVEIHVKCGVVEMRSYKQCFLKKYAFNNVEQMFVLME